MAAVHLAVVVAMIAVHDGQVNAIGGKWPPY